MCNQRWTWRNLLCIWCNQGIWVTYCYDVLIRKRVSFVPMKASTSRAHRSVLVTGLYAARYSVVILVTDVISEAYYSWINFCNVPYLRLVIDTYDTYNNLLGFWLHPTTRHDLAATGSRGTSRKHLGFGSHHSNARRHHKHILITYVHKQDDIYIHNARSHQVPHQIDKHAKVSSSSSVLCLNGVLRKLPTRQHLTPVKQVSQVVLRPCMGGLRLHSKWLRLRLRLV
jgi:hypothetical protein